MSAPSRPSSRSDLGRRGAAASQAHAAQAAREMLERGNAVDAIVAGVLAAAADSATVFFGPVQILVGGGGGGLLAIDGRIRQPGRGVPRPRGFLADEPVPAASRVGVPTLPGALAAAMATLGTLSLLRAAGPALALAKIRSKERAQFLEAFCRRGAPILTEGSILAELMAMTGRAARGLLTAEDLAQVRPDVIRFDERKLEPSGILTVPWRAPGGHEASHTHAVLAADARGMVAAACYESAPEGTSFPALGISAPASAEPVMRGQPRVPPGEARPAAAPLALRARRGLPDVALAVAASPDAEATLQMILDALDVATTVMEALSGARSGQAVALVRIDELTRVVASS